jgi:predicted adenylyl cyclase CyaB
MAHINIEIKARTNKPDEIRQYLLDSSADYKGLDVQTDTYFNVPEGRLKLRQGNIENSLIFYHRANGSGPKQSDFDLIQVDNGLELKSILEKAIGVKVTVTKHREIYYINNVKFHIDILDNIGHFVEIEATNKGFDMSTKMLHEQCNFYIAAFGIQEHDLVPISYSDMLLGT